MGRPHAISYPSAPRVSPASLKERQENALKKKKKTTSRSTIDLAKHLCNVSMECDELWENKVHDEVFRLCHKICWCLRYWPCNMGAICDFL
uniref:Uncharacterized protein n=1 Tax=Sus scrofa TaxID=9823 RepID=A0A8W4F7R6_PIG